MFDQAQWLKLQEAGVKSCSDKRYPQAEIIFADSLKLVRSALAEHKAAAKQEETSMAVEHDLQEKLAYSINNLAVAYQFQGKYGLALNQYIESTEIYRKLRGEKSLEFATSLHNLAIVYSAKEEYDQAETLFKRSLEIKEKLLDVTHPDLQALKVNMAQMLRNAGKVDEANKVLRKA